MLLVCYVLLYVVALCVKMRCVILCIKRLLIDCKKSSSICLSKHGPIANLQQWAGRR